MISLSHLVQIVVDKSVIEKLLRESFCEMEAEFKEEESGAPSLVNEQAIFTIWSLRRTSDLIAKIVAVGPVSEKLREEDSKIASGFSAATTWTQFDLDCLGFAARFNKKIQFEVLPEIQDGRRAAVNA